MGYSLRIRRLNQGLYNSFDAFIVCACAICLLLAISMLDIMEILDKV